MRDLTGYILDGRFLLKTQIGRGGSSTIWLAQDVTGKLSKYWAVKYVESPQKRPELLEKYREEVRVLDNLSHPNMSNIHYYAEKEDAFFLVINYINGDTLSHIVKSSGRQSEGNVVSWAKMLCDVLFYLHTVRENPIIYCDLNPQNIMIDDHNIPYLIDFGLATEIKRGEYVKGPPLGTSGYAAPEQYKKTNRIIDERTDVYGLGTTLFFLITGVNPKDTDKMPAELNEEISIGLNHLIMKCMEKNPKDRYQSIADVKQDLLDLYKYNDSYKKSLKRRIAAFCISALMCVISIGMTGIGYNGILNGNKQTYNSLYNTAQQSLGKGNYDEAEEEYIQAIAVNPDGKEAYQGLYSLLSAENSGQSTSAMTQRRVDSFKMNTVAESMKVVPNVLLNLSLDCLELNQVSYAQYASDLLNVLKTKSNYKQEGIDENEVDALAQIAKNGVELEPDHEKIKSAADKLKTASNESADDNTKIISDYVLIMLYTAYPDVFNDRNEINRVINESNDILERNKDNTEFAFTKKIPLCIMIASQYYLLGSEEVDAKAQNELFNNANSWMEKTGNIQLDVNDYILKGNILKGLKRYSEAKQAYQIALAQSPQNVDLLISLCQVCIDEQSVKAPKDKDYSEAKMYFNQITQIDNKNLPVVTLQQINSLKTQIGS
ncbi:MAG: protein kinase [Eubacteriaceae bacterium]|nr:protein kinase [Eubacteriaceae bacterium]